MAPDLVDARLKAANALESLAIQCQRERNTMLRFEDVRQLCATADIKRAYDDAIEACDALEDAFNELSGFGAEVEG